MIKNPEKQYRSNPVVSCGAEVDGAVLYNPDTDTTCVVNLTGRELWLFLRKSATTSEAAQYLVEQYADISLEQATEDVEAFITTLAPDFLLEGTDDR